MTNVLTALRDSVPIRPLTTVESIRIAELQATRFRTLTGHPTGALPEAAIADLPRVEVERMFPAPSSGATQWSLGRWLILLNGAESHVRQRFSLAHEFKHVLDDPFKKIIYSGPSDLAGGDHREVICDYFAGCLLMPRPDLKKVWCGGTQDIRLLARRFDVSLTAMRLRLTQIGLISAEPPRRHEERSLI